eukprot:m51a1_g103 hypothetical protein (180) ;mRNA; r:321684-322533
MSTLHSVSAAGGAFVLEDAPPGHCSLNGSASGFRNSTVTFTVGATDANVTLPMDAVLPQWLNVTLSQSDSCSGTLTLFVWSRALNSHGHNASCKVYGTPVIAIGKSSKAAAAGTYHVYVLFQYAWNEYGTFQQGDGTVAIRATDLLGTESGSWEFSSPQCSEPDLWCVPEVPGEASFLR